MAAAKQAGYFVAAIDAFADKETALAADELIIAACSAGSFDRDALLSAVSSLKHQYAGFIYGSGFEEQPALIAELAGKIPLLGNSASSIASLKNPHSFFTALQRLHIQYPAISTLPANIGQVYLKKRIGGCGGAHISIVGTEPPHTGNHYYQAHIEGRAVSLLFMAAAGEIEALGFNEQWTSPAKHCPFRYGGAVSHIDLSPVVKQQLIDAARKISAEFHLLGLNSLDAIVQNEVVYLLEINPRLSATVGLYDSAHLIEKHVQVCLTANLNTALAVPQRLHATARKSSTAHAIVYADSDLLIKHNFNWPDWVRDTPHLAMQIKAGEPVCSVIAVADNADEAKQLAHIRVKMLKIELLTQ